MGFSPFIRIYKKLLCYAFLDICLYVPNLSSAEKITMKMVSVNHTGELHVHESLETGPFMWTPYRCKGKLKIELLVSLYISVAGLKTNPISIQVLLSSCSVL